MCPDHGTSSSDISAQKNELHKTLVVISQTSAIQKIYQALGADSDLHIVGGVFRNLILERECGDIDLATVLLPEVVAQRLNQAGIKNYPTGIEHGTLSALIDEESFEITTFRKPGARVSGEYSDQITVDLSGRDFTVNALAFSLNNQEIIDPYQGLKAAIELKLICVVNPEERFKEDPLRLLRAARLISCENFTADNELTNAARKLAAEILSVSAERISTEFCKLIIGKFVRTAFEWMREIELLAVILPEIVPTIGAQQNKYHTEDVYNHTLTVIEGSYPSVKVRLAALFHDLGKPASMTIGEDGERRFYNHEELSAEIARKALPRFKLSANLSDSVIKLVSLHMRPIQCGPAGVRRLMRDLGTDFADWLLLKRADKTPVQDLTQFQSEFNEFIKMHLTEIEKLKDPVYGKLAINGDDLLSLGIPKGKNIGRILKQIENEVIENPEINKKEILVARAKELNENQ